jgi:stress response protein SCP2
MRKRSIFGNLTGPIIPLDTRTKNSNKEEILLFKNGGNLPKYELGEDFSIETGIEFGRLYRRNNEWKFDASGVGYKEDLAFFLSKYFSAIGW